MVGHDAVRKKFDVAARDGFTENAFEAGVLGITLKKARTFGCSVDDVEDETGGGCTTASRHGRSTTQARYRFVRDNWGEREK